MNLENNKNIVLTLDAGGTNFAFSAVQGVEEIVEPIVIPAEVNDLNKCLQMIIDGFAEVKSKLKENPVAISFAFPGPADYPNGIIGDLPNLPAFRGGVALGPMLKNKFNLPVFINNDGDLFAYGEAIAGFLPYVNKLFYEAGSNKQYKNLLGITLGTGFGCGIVRDGELFLGDNAVAAELWLMRSKLYPFTNVEQTVGVGPIKRFYREFSNGDESDLTPKDIYEIAIGKKDGDKAAAIKSFRKMGEAIGDALANAITLIDGLIVIGGGISAAYDILIDAILSEMNSKYKGLDGSEYNRLVFDVFDFENLNSREIFLKGTQKKLKVPFFDDGVEYDSMSRTAIGLSKLGTTRAVSIGAYAYAMRRMGRI